MKQVNKESSNFVLFLLCCLKSIPERRRQQLAIGTTPDPAIKVKGGRELSERWQKF